MCGLLRRRRSSSPARPLRSIYDTSFAAPGKLKPSFLYTYNYITTYTYASVCMCVYCIYIYRTRVIPCTICMYIVRWLFYYLQPAAAPRKYDIIFTRNKYIITLHTVSYIFLTYVLSLEETKYQPDRPKVLGRRRRKNVSPRPPGLNGDLSLTVGGMKAETDARPGWRCLNTRGLQLVLHVVIL